MKTSLLAFFISISALVLYSTPAQAQIRGRLDRGETKYFKIQAEKGDYPKNFVSIEGKGKPSMSLYSKEGKLLGSTSENLVFPLATPSTMFVSTTCEQELCYYQIVFWSYTDRNGEAKGDTVDTKYREMYYLPFLKNSVRTDKGKKELFNAAKYTIKERCAGVVGQAGNHNENYNRELLPLGDFTKSGWEMGTYCEYAFSGSYNDLINGNISIQALSSRERKDRRSVYTAIRNALSESQAHQKRINSAVNRDFMLEKTKPGIKNGITTWVVQTYALSEYGINPPSN